MFHLFNRYYIYIISIWNPSASFICCVLLHHIIYILFKGFPEKEAWKMPFTRIGEGVTTWARLGWKGQCNHRRQVLPLTQLRRVWKVQTREEGGPDPPGWGLRRPNSSVSAGFILTVIGLLPKKEKLSEESWREGAYSIHSAANGHMHEQLGDKVTVCRLRASVSPG